MGKKKSAKAKAAAANEAEVITTEATAPNGEPINADSTSEAVPATPEEVETFENAKEGSRLDEPGKAKEEDAPAVDSKPAPKAPLTDAEKKKRAADRRAEKKAAAEELKKLAADPEEVVEAIEAVTYEKDFVVLARDHDSYRVDHSSEFAFTVREALAQGWRAVAEPEYKGMEAHVDGVSVILHYAVEVVPAS